MQQYDFQTLTVIKFEWFCSLDNYFSVHSLWLNFSFPEPSDLHYQTFLFFLFTSFVWFFFPHTKNTEKQVISKRDKSTGTDILES